MVKMPLLEELNLHSTACGNRNETMVTSKHMSVLVYYYIADT